jgi:hypothetical protein
VIVSIKITCAQHIYANLTTAQSPVGSRGYQTLVCTRSRLSPASIKMIEARLQHHSTHGPKNKWQFYGLPGGQVVISYLTAVPDPDEFGRTGRFLAHSIVVESRDWELIGSTPFALMLPARFCQSMDQALAMGNLKAGELGTSTLDISRYDSQHAIALSKQWTNDELWKLIRLARHTQSILQRGSFVCFVGNSAQLQEALEVALSFSPLPHTNCAFDTSSAGCSWSREVKFWAQGFATEREARTPFVVLAEQKKVRFPNDWSPPETPDEVWLKTQVNNRTLSTFPQHQAAVELISAALTGERVKPFPSNVVSEVVKNDFASANQEMINQRIDSLLSGLPQFVLDMINRRIGQGTKARLDWLLANPGGEGIGELLFEILGDWSEGPHPDVKRSMTPFIERHASIRLIFSLWAQDKRAVQSSLSAMDSNEYKRCVHKLSYRKYAELQDLFSARHLDEWFQICGGRYELEHIAGGISLVAKYGSQNDCDRLSVLTHKINSDQERNDLMRWLEIQPFQKQVKPLIAALKESVRPQPNANSGSWLARRLKRIQR